MRKALIAGIVASALFAVGAFAASFGVEAEDIASGANSVEACADTVRITFNEPAAATTGGRWTVTQATATFLNGESAALDCVGFDADLALDIDTSSPLDNVADSSQNYDEVQVTNVGGNVTAVFNLTTPTTYVDAVVGASVVVDDALILDASTEALD